jgi:hypothetical protein
VHGEVHIGSDINTYGAWDDRDNLDRGSILPHTGYVAKILPTE